MSLAVMAQWPGGSCMMDTYGYVLPVVHHDIRHSNFKLNSESPGLSGGLSVETLPTTRHEVQDGGDAGRQGGGRVYEDGWSPQDLGLDEEPTDWPGINIYVYINRYLS
jgi:hypothetical protein